MEDKLTKIKDSEFRPKWENKILIAEITIGIAFGIFVLLFCIHQPWFKWTQPIDTGKWGTFGDFIGGLLGTACAYISLRLLIKNLKEQEKANSFLRESNDRSSEVFEMQLLRENISTLLDSYKRVVASFKIDKNIPGTDSIKSIAQGLYENYEVFGGESLESRVEDARKLFDTEYIKYRDTLAVYYRLLYQIFQNIWMANIDSKKKAMLSKMLRSQFTEDELLLLRYNCLTPNGEKMRFYINQFNLLKHLPLSHLLEFKKWVADLSDVQKNRLDTECVRLRKCIKNLLIKNSGFKEEQQLDYSKRYRGIISISADRKECYFEIIRNTNEIVSEDETSMDNVLEKWDDEKIRSFFIEFFMFVFDFSNFSLFNKVSELDIQHDIKTEDNGKKHTIWTLVKKDNSPLVVSMPQDDDPKK